MTEATLSAVNRSVTVNASPEPFTNWMLSFAEDLFVVGFSYAALQYPYLALLVSVALLTAIVLSASLLVRFVRRRFRTAD